MHLAFLAMIVLMVTLLVLGCPVGISMIAAGFLYVLLAHMDPGFLTQQIVAGLFNNFLGLSIPLFIFSAKVMTPAASPTGCWGSSRQPSGGSAAASAT
jgi:C4-dicarboxylate transporter DctM subunit